MGKGLKANIWIKKGGQLVKKVLIVLSLPTICLIFMIAWGMTNA